MENNNPNLTSGKGFEIGKNQVSLSFAMCRKVFFFCAACWIVAFGYWFNKDMNGEDFSLLKRYYYAKQFADTFPNGKWLSFTFQGNEIDLTSSQLITNPYTVYHAKAISKIWVERAKKEGSITGGLALLLFVLVIILLKRYSKRKMQPRYIRGTRLISEKQLRKEAKREIDDQQTFNIGSIPIPYELEPKSFFFAGSPGCGKTQAILPMIKSAQNANRKILVYDYKGDFTSKMFRQGRDFIFNPLDNRSLRWTIFNDINTVQDVHKIAYSLLPDSGNLDNNSHFRNAARDLFIAILNYCHQMDIRTNKDLWGNSIVADRRA